LTAIVAEAIGRDYGSFRAVDAIDFRVEPGEFFGFLGPNGAGKTTTIRMLTTLLRPSRGSAQVAGHDVVSDPLAVRRRIGIVFQETTLDLDLTAEENLRFAARLYGLTRRDAAIRCAEALELVGLTDRRDDLVRSFSGGMRRALDLARGTLHRPEILFLDEPTLGLDPAHRRRIWEFLRQVAGELGTTLFLTTHYLEEADPCNRVAIVDRGRIIAEGRPEELKQRVGRETVVLAGAPADELAAEVRRLVGVEAQPAQDGVSIAVEHAGDALQRLLPLAERGVRLEVRRPTLEDVFVALTDRSSSPA
jgi:ABC-2 type transport system ATP-binding protein